MRPVGKNVRAVMEIIDADGPLSYMGVFLLSDLDGSENATKYLRRCVAMGYATVDTSVCPRVYSAVQGWRTAIDAPRVLRAVQKPAACPYAALGCFFVWAGERDKDRLQLERKDVE